MATVSNFIGLAPTAQRHHTQCSLDRFWFHLCCHWGFNKPRCDSPTTNTEAPQLPRPSNCHCYHTCFSGRIVGLTNITSARHTGDINDHAALISFRHMCCGFTATQETTGQVDIQYRLKLDRKSTRLNSSHVRISYAVFCLKK